MTKKHFIRAAEIVATEFPRGAEQQAVADAFIMLFRAYNDRFDTARFIAACGLAGEKD